VTNGLGRSAVEIGQGNMRSVNVVQVGDRTRVVLNLKQATTYRAQLQGNSLLVILDGASTAAAAPAAAAAPSFSAAAAPGVQGLKDVDFRRGNDGAGRVVVELGNSQTGVDIKQQG
jgi:type IV pilus assembly protein PilQ